MTQSQYFLLLGILFCIAAGVNHHNPICEIIFNVGAIGLFIIAIQLRNF